MTVFSLVILVGTLGFLLIKQWNTTKEVRAQVAALNTELARFSPITDLDAEIKKRKTALDGITALTSKAETDLKDYQIRLDLEEMSYYRPRYEFDDVASYAEALALVRDAQKELIKQKRAFRDPSGNEVRGNLKGFGKLSMNAFNGEAEGIIGSVSYNNFEQSKEKMRVLFNKLNNLTGPHEVVLSEDYLTLKIKEMAIAFDYREAEQKAKDEQAELKAQMREEEHARAEAEDARAAAIKEQEQYQAALAAARKELESKSEGERAEYEKKIQALQQKFDDATAERQRATAMAQITKKGHVYVISNVGSFGENIFKIGLTRRKDPMERIKELSDASVPFCFDVHAVIYAEDAPALESELHRHFDAKRMNKVNARKEFFRVTLEEIARGCEKMGHQTTLTKLAEAREYRETLALEQKNRAA